MIKGISKEWQKGLETENQVAKKGFCKSWTFRFLEKSEMSTQASQKAKNLIKQKIKKIVEDLTKLLEISFFVAPERRTKAPSSPNDMWLNNSRNNKAEILSEKSLIT